MVWYGRVRDIWLDTVSQDEDSPMVYKAEPTACILGDNEARDQTRCINFDRPSVLPADRAPFTQHHSPESAVLRTHPEAWTAIRRTEIRPICPGLSTMTIALELLIIHGPRVTAADPAVIRSGLQTRCARRRVQLGRAANPNPAPSLLSLSSHSPSCLRILPRSFTAGFRRVL